MTDRADVVRVARTQVDTPFLHRGRQSGLALDCAGLLVCVARELGLVDGDFDVPPYTPTPDGRSMLAWCRRYMKPVAKELMRPGDALVMITDKHPQHLGILGDYRNGGLSLIHASNSNSTVPPRVIETRLMFSRVQRYVASFKLPGIE